MNEVHIQTDDLKEVAQKISVLAHEMKDTATEIQKEADDLEGWSDSAAEQFAETITDVCKTLECNIRIFSELAVYLRQYAESQEAAEEAQRRAMENIASRG